MILVNDLNGSLIAFGQSIQQALFVQVGFHFPSALILDFKNSNPMSVLKKICPKGLPFAKIGINSRNISQNTKTNSNEEVFCNCLHRCYSRSL
jgi:hypothetical protein